MLDDADPVCRAQFRFWQDVDWWQEGIYSSFPEVNMVDGVIGCNK